MYCTNIRQNLQNRIPVRGAWLSIPSVHSARLLGRMPFDCLVVDAEHTPLNPAEMHAMVAAIAEGRGPAPIVRVAEVSCTEIKRALDAGAYGIIAPSVNTPIEAEAVVAWSKFPPEGRRSFGSAYAGLAFGQHMVEYLRAANQQIMTAIQVEHQDALGNLDALFQTKGLDMVFVGPVDLSISLGIEPVPENNHPIFLSVLRDIQRAAAVHGVPLGIYCSNAEAAKKRIAEGFMFVNIASDLGILTAGMRDALS